MHRATDGAPDPPFRHAAEQELDTAEEQAHALLVDLRESFAPSYLTLISIIEGVLLALLFEQLADRHGALQLGDPGVLVLFNNFLLIVLVWNEYRMGSSMFRWVPYLLDAIIPFALGSLQAALVLASAHRLSWLGWLATFYLAAVIAYENMYRRAGEEQCNAFSLEHNRGFRRMNVTACLIASAAIWTLFLLHRLRGSVPGWGTLTAVTAWNLAFVVRGEVSWRMIVAAARRTAKRG